MNAFRRSRRTRGGSRRRGILFNRGAKFVERAVVELIFPRNPLGNGLHAFEARGGVKVSALLAAMQFESATRALSFRIETRLQHGAAIRTARACNRAHHARCSRSDLFLPWMAFVVLTFFFFLGLVGTLVAPVLILPVQGNLRGDAQSYSESEHASRILSESVDNLNIRLIAGQNRSRAVASRIRGPTGAPILPRANPAAIISVAFRHRRELLRRPGNRSGRLPPLWTASPSMSSPLQEIIPRGGFFARGASGPNRARAKTSRTFP